MFRKFFGSDKKSKPEVGPPALSPAIAGSIVKALGSRGLPTMPGAAQKAFKLTIDPDAEIRDFIEVIESDEALSARVIKISNSVYFDRGNPSKTIQESVVNIGINELKSLLNATTLSELFPSRHPLRAELWAHDIATALTAKSIAARILPEKTDNAFLGGLMHDLGKLLLLQRIGKDYAEVVSLVKSKGISFCAAEEDLFVFNHTEVGQLIGEQWNFTEELLEIIRHHHQPFPSAEDEAESVTLIQIVKSADIIAHALGLGHGPGLTKFQDYNSEQLEEVWEVIQVDTSERRDFLAAIRRIFDLEYDLYKG